MTCYKVTELEIVTKQSRKQHDGRVLKCETFANRAVNKKIIIKPVSDSDFISVVQPMLFIVFVSCGKGASEEGEGRVGRVGIKVKKITLHFDSLKSSLITQFICSSCFIHFRCTWNSAKS